MNRKTVEEIITVIDNRTEVVFELFNRSIVSESRESKINAMTLLATTIKKNKSMIELLDKLILDEQKNKTKKNLFSRIKSVYWLVKLRNYYVITHNEIMKTAIEHGFVAEKTED